MESCRENLLNEVERAIKTEIDEQNKKKQASSVGFFERHKPQRPHLVSKRGSHLGREEEER